MSPRTLAIALFAAVGLAGLEAQAPYLEPDTLQALEASGELHGSLSVGAAPQLLPAMPRRAQILEELRARELTVGVEILSLYQEEGAALDTPEALLRLYNLMHALSGMKGLEYYSSTRKRMRILYTESYTLDDPVSRKPVPDRVFLDGIPAEDQAYLYQKDLNFGGTVYRVEYFFEDGVMSLHTTNLTPMRFLGIQLIQEGDSLSWVCLIPSGNRILFYGLTGGKTAKFLGLDKSGSREDSFYHRLKAILGWFTRAVGQDS